MKQVRSVSVRSKMNTGALLSDAISNADERIATQRQTVRKLNKAPESRVNDTGSPTGIRELSKKALVFAQSDVASQSLHRHTNGHL